MKPKTVLWLGVAAGIAMICAMIAVTSQPRMQTSADTGEALFPALATQASALKTVVIRHGPNTISLDWDGTTWRYRERANYPVARQKVTDLIVGLARLTKLEEKTRSPDRYARLDLQDTDAPGSNAREVALIDRAGKEILTVIVGKRKYTLGGREGGTYVRIPGDPQTWLVRGEVNPGANPRDWLDRTIADIPAAAIKRVTVIHPSGERVVVSRAAADVPFTIENLPRGAGTDSDLSAEEYGRILTGLDADDVAAADSVTFARDKTFSATVDGFDGFKVTLETTEVDGKNWLKISAQPPAAAAGTPASVAAAMADIETRASGRVFQVPAYKVDLLKHRPSDLRRPAPRS